MIVTMMTVLVVLHAAVGASPAVCPIPLIEAVEGDNVTLPCHLYPEVNVEGHTFDWKRDGLEKWVFVYRDKKPVEDDQRDEYKNRTHVDPVGLKRGNMSLLIFPVKLSDSGSYKCFNAKMNSSCYANLSVVPKDQTKSRDSTTNVPPTSDDLGAEKKTEVWIVGSVLGVLGVLVVLVMKYKVVDIWRNFRGRRPNNDEPGTRQMEQGEDSELIVNNDNSSGKSSNKIY